MLVELNALNSAREAGREVKKACNTHNADMERRARIALQRAINRIHVGKH